MSDDSGELSQRHCVPCEGGTPPLDAADIAALLPRVPAWTMQHGAQGDELTRTVTTDDFVGAVDLVDRLTPIAESEGHHPDLEVGWGRVAVHLTTHAAGGLTPNDFIMAAKLDQLFDAK
ncbi:MAG: 4a-hydroxytetrahydrobiopterin dehydratase [Candidatus Dormibacteraceae bacterium]